ncbi:MAG: GNAT family N-acetyltransferase [Legionellaceae bacterium]|nr:GNAT family N-acetyltransferase [Legionellaceae bacterium]
MNMQWTGMLNDAQFDALKKLCDECDCADAGLPALHWHLLMVAREEHSNILYWDNGRLVGFISIYFFFANRAEISLLVAPSHRRQGIARRLLSHMLPMCHRVETIVFSASPTLSWLSQHSLQYDHSDYPMQRKQPVSVTCTQQLNYCLTRGVLQVRTATLQDIDVLCTIDAACFPDESSEMQERFEALLSHPSYTVVVGEFQNNIVGKAHIRWETEDAYFSDIGVLPAYQCQGLGSDLLAAIIKVADQNHKMIQCLEVEARDIKVLNLYRRLGFEVKQVIDFWSVSVENLQILLDV